MERRDFYWLLRKRPIVFPLIQRDYAQGRTDAHSSVIRKSLIASLLRAVERRAEKKPLILGSIFGRCKDGRFEPFDGQQRLCGLWLLHLHAAVRAGLIKNSGIISFFQRLRYESREEAAIFMNSLLRFLADAPDEALQKLFSDPRPEDLIGPRIKKQPWFSPAWRRDQSVCGFLVTLDEIRRAFAKVHGLWEILTDRENPPIQFYFADIADFDAPADGLFINMNARGKGLGRFEKFKAAFLEWMKMEAPEKEELFAQKMDMEWQDLFWGAFGRNYEGDKARRTDLCFYNFMSWLGGVMAALTKGGRAVLTEDPLALLAAKAPEEGFLSSTGSKISFMENVLDSLALLERQGGVESFLQSVFLGADNGIMPVPGKISWFHGRSMFREICLSGKPGAESSLMFFAIILVLANNLKEARPEGAARQKEIKPDKEQLLRLRVTRNLIENSKTEMEAAPFGALLKGVARVINKEPPTHVFNDFQLGEELAKLKARQEDPALAENLDWLEDHPLLRGCAAVFSAGASYRNKLKFSARELAAGRRLFERALGEKPVAWDQLLRGFLCGNIFGLREGSLSNKYFYLGRSDNDGRRKIFTTARADCFFEIRDAVRKLADKIPAASDYSMETTLELIASKWVEKGRRDKRMDWRWYFVAYPEILPAFSQTDGYYDWGYSWRSFEQRQLRKQILKGPHRNPFLWAVYVEAGFLEMDADKRLARFEEASGKGRDNPIAFPALKLGLWGGELYWRAWALKGRPGKQQLEFLNELRKRLEERGIKINDGGYILIPGKDSREWSGKTFAPEATADVVREYDKEDRVRLGKLIALEMMALSKGGA